MPRASSTLTVCGLKTSGQGMDVRPVRLLFELLRLAEDLFQFIETKRIPQGKPFTDKNGREGN